MTKPLRTPTGFSDASQADFLRALQDARATLVSECRTLDADEDIDRVAGAVAEYDERIIGTPADGPEDLRVKLAVLWEYMAPSPETERDLRTRLIRSIMADVDRMAKGEGAAIQARR
ncbi:MAG: hypothetical protein HQL36_01925 [Alphaproteobacteria bacterium]|nr:hypothetical protein [Alphaproteobacteria bacterium]